MDAIEISAVAMRNDLLKLNSLSNNAANISTPGYKREITSTVAFLSSVNQFQNTESISGLATGEGTLPTVNFEIDYSTGTLKFTGNAMDLAIEGDGFFELTNGQATYYSKRGDFVIDNNGRVMLSGTDMYLNGLGGELRLSTTTPEIDAEGRIKEDGENVGQLKVVHLKNTDQLMRIGNGIFQSSGSVLAAEEVRSPVIKQGFVEASNTKPAHEMLELVKLARHMESTQQVIRGYDGMLETVIDDLGNF